MALPAQARLKYKKLIRKDYVSSGPPPREGAIVEIAVPSSCLAFVEGPAERSPAVVTKVYDHDNPHSSIACLIMEAGMTPETRLTVHYGWGEYQWHWPTRRSIGE